MEGKQEDMDAWKEKIQQDIHDLKQDQSQLKNDIDHLKINDTKQDEKILSLQDTLKAIQDDTQWIRRKFTGAFIKAFITTAVAGLVGYAFTNIFGG